MKFMLIMRADAQGVEAYKDMPFDEVIAAMGRYNESMIKAGVLLAGEGLTDAAEGFVVDFSAETPLVTDGPYGETKELFNGFWIIETSTREEAAEWAKRAPARTRIVSRGAPGDRAGGLPRRQRVDPEGGRLARGGGRARRRVSGAADQDGAGTMTGSETTAAVGSSLERTVAAVWRIESAKIVATLTRFTGDFGLAEDLAQEALVEALAQWPRDGVPAKPAAWLTAVAKRRAIDAWRRRERYDDRLAVIAHDLEREQDTALDAPPWDPDAIDDDVLRLDLHRVPPGALPRGPGGAHAARGRRPDQRADRPRLPGADRDRAAPHHPGQEDPRRRQGAVRGAAARGVRRSGWAAVLSVLYLIFNEAHAATAGRGLDPPGPRSARRCGWRACSPP